MTAAGRVPGRSKSVQTVLQESQAISTNFRHNEQIRISPIRLIDQNDNQIGIISTSEAMRMAREAAMDLVEVAPTARPPVCRIMDYGKWRYQQQKKDDKSRASHKGGRLKMLNVDTTRIGEHDLGIKINRARDFLKEGNKVQFTLRFKGREMAHIDLGYKLFDRVKTELWQFSKVERQPKMEGKRMTMVLQPEHKAPGAKPPEPTQRAGSGLNIPPRPVGAGTGPVGPGAPRPAPVGGPVGTGPRPAAAAPVAPRPAPTPATAAAPAAPAPATAATQPAPASR